MLRIVFSSAKGDSDTLNYIDLQCEGWSVVGNLLAVSTTSGVRYFVLANIESFIELEAA